MLNAIIAKRISTLVLAFVFSLAAFNANAAEPSPINDVTVSTYSHINAGNSKNVFELFWNQSSEPVSYYEVWLFGD